MNKNSSNFEQKYTMYEKILQKLKLQRGQRMSISDKSLEDFAKSYALVLLTDDQLNTMDFNPLLESISGNISHVASEAAKSAEDKAKKEAAKNATQQAQQTTSQQTASTEGKKSDEVTPEWAKALFEATKALTDKVQKMEGEKIVLTRKQILEEKLKETPDIYKNTVLKSFERATFKDDEDFNAYVAEIENDTKTVIQEGKEKGLVFSAPGKNPLKPDPESVSPEMEKTLKALTEVKEIKKPY